jgi:predicted amidohydrolase
LRTWAFLNISAIGLGAETGEAQRQELCDAELCRAAVEEDRDFIIGVKCPRRVSKPLGGSFVSK